MTTEQIIGIIAVSVVGMLSFFLRSAFNSVTTRLDKLETALVELLVELRESNITAKTHSEEITNLRRSNHDLRNIVQEIQLVQNRCRTCSPKN